MKKDMLKEVIARVRAAPNMDDHYPGMAAKNSPLGRSYLLEYNETTPEKVKFHLGMWFSGAKNRTDNKECGYAACFVGFAFTVHPKEDWHSMLDYIEFAQIYDMPHDFAILIADPDEYDEGSETDAETVCERVEWLMNNYGDHGIDSKISASHVRREMEE